MTFEEWWKRESLNAGFLLSQKSAIQSLWQTSYREGWEARGITDNEAVATALWLQGVGDYIVDAAAEAISQIDPGLTQKDKVEHGN